jgi:Tfp pilus assembly protein PilN
MRAVNLIPPDERRGDSAPLRTGSMVYVLVAGLALLLLGIVVVALTGKQISDRKADKANLQQELSQVSARAQSLNAFVEFRQVQESRASTIASLAQSRFDWERVLHELALVLPSDVQLSSVTGSVSPDVQLSSSGSSSGSGESNLRDSIDGPALSIVGCAPSQDAVAGFVSSLEDIDGVTRVGVASSKRPEQSAMTGEPGDQSSTPGDCQVQDSIYKFEIVAAFDAVPTPSTDGSAPSTPAPSPTPATPPTSTNQVSDGQTQENVQQAAVRQQTAKVDKARSAVPGG